MVSIYDSRGALDVFKVGWKNITNNDTLKGSVASVLNLDTITNRIARLCLNLFAPGISTEDLNFLLDAEVWSYSLSNLSLHMEGEVTRIFVTARDFTIHLIVTKQNALAR